MYKINGISPIYMCNAITMCSDVANRDTRMSDASNMTVVPPASRETFKNSFSYRGPIIWNTLPEHLRSCCTLKDLKKKMKIYVLSYRHYVIGHFTFYCASRFVVCSV